MNISLALSKLPLGIAYFIAASAALTLTRYDGGVAFLWVACALLIADLVRTRRSRWLYSIVPCVIASGVATGLFGLGWQVAPLFCLLNAAEAVIAAWLIRRSGRRHRSLGSLASLWQFVLAAGIAAPLTAAAMAGLILSWMGQPAINGMVDVATGHALGNITFTPLAMLVADGKVWRKLSTAEPRKIAETVALLLLTVMVSVGVFTQQQQPLLFLPILPVIIIAFRVGAAPTVIAVVLLALIGSAATLYGIGPVNLLEAAIDTRLQFFQFYLAMTVLTALPVAVDLKNRQRLHHQSQGNEARFRLLADHSTDVLLHLEVDGRIRYISPSVTALSGHCATDLTGRSSVLLVAPEHRANVIAAHKGVVAAGGDTQSYEYLGLSVDGSTRWFESQSRAICDEQGNVESLLSIARDISARKIKELRLASEAMTDPLTGLPNRRSFKAAVDRRVGDWRENREACIALFDIDRFKRVNDLHGHEAGDAVLRTFAEVVRRVVRDDDSIARIGGEEFAILFPSTAVPQALLICDRLRREMARAVTVVNGEPIRVTISGGVAALGRRGPDFALKQADEALYSAKRGGRDQMALAA
ncbi:MAG: diguanylate cyclase [Pseudomonadota bacterium]|nr:diguanylate cyclase [Pseudomonadota bacterium]